MNTLHELKDDDGDKFTLDLHDEGWIELIVTHESGCIVLDDEKAMNLARLINEHFGVKNEHANK